MASNWYSSFTRPVVSDDDLVSYLNEGAANEWDANGWVANLVPYLNEDDANEVVANGWAEHDDIGRDNQSDKATEGSEKFYYDSADPPTCESEEEGQQKKVKAPASIRKKGRPPFYNPACDFPELEEGLLFEDSDQFKSAMVKYVVHFKRNIYFKRNERLRIRVKCIESCPFVCHCSWEERYKCLQLKTCILEHRCNLEYILKIVSQKWLEEKYEDKIIKNPTQQDTKLRGDIESDLRISVSKSMVRRVKQAVLEKLKLGYSDQFKRIRDYAQECLNSNPGSTAVIKTTSVVLDSPCIFQRMYVCFEAMKSGFLAGCRKIIGLDGCFLKGFLKGELLTAIGRDSNNQMYPIAWAVVEIENTDSWRWFMELLIQDLGITNTYEWTLISYQQKGLVNVIQEMLPDVEHKNCARHIHANWSKKHKGKVLKNYFWMCAKSTTEEQFNTNCEKLGMKDAQAKSDLAKYPAKHWCKAFMRTTVKCDSVDNNICEAFNGTIVNARSKPIIKMLEDIRVANMTRIARCRNIVEKWPGNFGPRIMKKLNENIEESFGWRVDFNGDDGYEIKNETQQFKVKLEGKKCSCRSWDLTGIPCAHAVCAIFNQQKNPEDYIDECYSKANYKRIYSHTIQPLNREMYWPKTNNAEIVAPAPRKMTGRPKKKRICEPNEPRVGKLSREGRIMTCSNCKQKGHNIKVCPNPPPTNSGTATATTTRPAAITTTRTGAQILNPGQRGQRVINVGGNASALGRASQ